MHGAKLLESILAEDHEGDGRFRGHFGDATAWAALALLERRRRNEASAEDERVLDLVLRRERRLVGLSLRPGGPRSRLEAEEGALGLLALLAAREARHPLAPPRGAIEGALAAADAAATMQGGLVRWPRADNFGPAALTAALAYGLARVGRPRRALAYARRAAAAAEDDAMARAVAAAAVARAGERDEARVMLGDAAARCRMPDGFWREHVAHGGKRMLSVQLFVAFAQLEAGDTDAARRLLEATWRAAWDGHRLVHDWNGDTRADWSCTGCNLQAAWLADALRDAPL